MTEGHRRGGVRIRSNVVFAKNGRAAEESWAHVPGEIVEIHKPGYLRGALTSQKRQRDERGYYLECSFCHRLAHQIGREGCEDPRCGLSRPSPESVERNQGRHHEALELLALEREHLTEQGLSGTEEDLDLPAVLSPEAAVERLLGRESVAPPEVLEEPSPEVIQPEADTAGAYEAARSALVDAAEATGRFAAGYCTGPVDNLVDTLALGQARQALDDLAHGDGSELTPTETTPPKFHATHSSSALVINTFAAWIGREQWLHIGEHAGFPSLKFEAKFPTGLAGRPPNLDVYVSGPSSHLAIESKCTEHCRRTRPRSSRATTISWPKSPTSRGRNCSSPQGRSGAIPVARYWAARPPLPRTSTGGPRWQGSAARASLPVLGTAAASR